MLSSVYWRVISVGRRRLTSVKIVVCFITVCVLLYIYGRRAGSLPPPVVDRTPLATFVHRSRPTGASAALPTVNGGTIPKIVHQTWKSPADLPETFRNWMSSWLRHNQEWDYWLWTDNDIRLLITSVFPQYLPLFDSYPAQSYRVDAFRYFVLYEYGGLYADLDMECLRPIDAAFNQSDCVVSQEPLEHAEFLAPVGTPLVSNALMACRPGHPFFAHVISRLSSYTGWLTWNNVLWATGPYMLSSVYRDYDRRRRQWNSDGAVTVAAPDVFQPTPDDSMVDYMRRACLRSDVIARQRALCARLVAYDFGRSGTTKFPAAFTVHHWTHSWVGRRNDPYGLLNEKLKRFDAGELVHTSKAHGKI